MAQQLAADIAASGGQQRDISNRLTVVDAKNTPFFSMIPKGDQEYKNQTLEWPTDKNLEPEHSAIKDGTDTTEFENTMGNYSVLKNQMQWFRPKGWQIGKKAMVGTNLAGVKNLKARAMAKKMIQLKRMLEASLGSDLEQVTETGAVAGVSRGAGVFLQTAAQAVNPIDANYRPPTGSVDTTASASVTETIVQNLLQSSYEQTGQKKTFSLICGPNHRKIYRTFTEKQTSSTNVMSAIRTFTQDATSKKLVNTVNIYEGDFGTLELIESLWLAFYTAADTSKTAANDATQLAISKARAYGLDMENWEWVGQQAPMSETYPDLGGGPRGAVDAIGALKVWNPRGEIMFAPAS